MADNEVKFLLDLDIADFTEQGLKAKGIIEQIGSSENMTGLIEGLTKTSALLGTVGAVVYTFKEALDLTLEGEKLNKINQQFEFLTTQAGLSGEALKTSLIEASGGLISTTDLIQTANKALVAMGASAEQLPEVMELARKASSVFGTDLTSTFDNITQAISMGNTRMLKHMGIIVDVNKAVQDFAKQQGIAVNSVNQAGRQQAILNAVLEQGDKTFGDMNIKTGTATQLLGTLKITVTELSEVFTKAFERTIGPTVRSALGSLVELADTMKTKVTASFGAGAEQSAAKIKLLEKQITDTKTALTALQTKNSIIGTILPGFKASAIEAGNKTLKGLESQLTVLKAQNEQLTQAEKEKGLAAAANAKSAQKNVVDEKIAQANKLKFEKDLLQLDKDTVKAMETNVKSLGDVDKLITAQRALYAKEYAAKRSALEKADYLGTTEKKIALNKLDETFKAQESQRETDLKALRTKAMADYVSNSTNAIDGIGRAMKQMGAQAEQDLTDFGKQGQQVMQNFQSFSTQAFDQIGQAIASGKDVAKATADAMLGFFLNMIASYAAQWGATLLAVGIGTGNPLAIAEGAGLLILAGAVKGLAGALGGGSGPASTPATTGGGGGVSTGPTPVSLTPSPPPIQQPGTVTTPGTSPTPGGVPGDIQSSSIETAASAITPISTPQGNAIPTVPIDTGNAPLADQAMPGMEQSQANKKTVHINIAGNYFDTDTTRRQLMEMVRQETDATDFTYNKIGV